MRTLSPGGSCPQSCSESPSTAQQPRQWNTAQSSGSGPCRRGGDAGIAPGGMGHDDDGGGDGGDGGGGGGGGGGDVQAVAAGTDGRSTTMVPVGCGSFKSSSSCRRTAMSSGRALQRGARPPSLAIGARFAILPCHWSSRRVNPHRPRLLGSGPHGARLSLPGPLENKHARRTAPPLVDPAPRSPRGTPPSLAQPMGWRGGPVRTAGAARAVSVGRWELLSWRSFHRSTWRC